MHLPQLWRLLFFVCVLVDSIRQSERHNTSDPNHQGNKAHKHEQQQRGGKRQSSLPHFFLDCPKLSPPSSKYFNSSGVDSRSTISLLVGHARNMEGRREQE